MRSLVLNDAFERVIRATSLRRPQREALREVHNLFSEFGRDLRDMTTHEVRFKVKERFPTFDFGGEFPVVDILLATGVGKTRLMGAIISYLYLSGQSSNFVMMAPRRAIMRKLLSETRSTSDKYIFVDPAFVPNPVVWHSGNLDAFAPDDLRLPGTPKGPNIFIFSPQSFVGADRRAWKHSEFTGTSVGRHLAQQDDLVVLVDEAHHLGGQEEADARSWTEAVRDLEPKIQVGMSATPLEHANLLYSYDLATCLREGLYTKAVKIIVDQKPTNVDIDPVAWDHRTLDFALDRLTRKQRAIQAHRKSEIEFPNVHPVLLICAENTAHADEVATWLRSSRGFEPSAVLVTHSKKSKTEDEIQALLTIQEPNSRVRVVVNVFELTEGWDVTNVYVVAPLRKLGTFQGAVQTMGRGLRLPGGSRVGDEAVDTLDMLCFGSESLQDVLNRAIDRFGESEDQDSPIDIGSKDDEDLDPPLLTSLYEIPIKQSAELAMSPVRFRPPEVDLSRVAVDITAGIKRGAVEIDLGRLERLGTIETLKYDKDQFERIVVSRVLEGLSFLSDPQHRDGVRDLVGLVLNPLQLGSDQAISIDPHLLAELMKDWIRTARGREDARYEVSGRPWSLVIGPITTSVPDGFDRPLRMPKKWVSSRHWRIPIAGWSKCIHEAAAFDTSGEFHLANVLDTANDSTWWFRNPPSLLKISTPLGNYSPDLVCHVHSPVERIVLVQAKGDHLWESKESDARVKARAAVAFCTARNEIGERPEWSHRVILQSDASTCQTIRDIDSLAVEP